MRKLFVAIAVVFAAIAVVAVVVICLFIWQRSRHEHFRRHLDETTTYVAEVVDKIDSNSDVFDSADNRAADSVQKLKSVAYTDRQRDGAAQLFVELGTLRTCRAARHLPGDRFKKCIDACLKINFDAFDKLGEKY